MTQAWLRLSVFATLLAPLLMIGQQASSLPSEQMRVDHGTLANGSYTNTCLGFTFPIPDSWEISKDADSDPGKAKRIPGGGLVLLVLDQHTERSFRNRMVLTAVAASSFTVNAEAFVSKFVQAEINANRDGREVTRNTFPVNQAGAIFFREDYRESFSGGTLYKAFVATKFRGYFLTWTLVAGSPEELDAAAESLRVLSFQEDHPDSPCAAGPNDSMAMGGVIGGILSSTPVPSPSQPESGPIQVRVGQGVAQGLLVKQVQPEYPQTARMARIQGVVVLKALIDTDGNVQELTLISGHPLLAPAAIAAVKQWKYKPYLLQGRPVSVDTQIAVSFQLAVN